MNFYGKIIENWTVKSVEFPTVVRREHQCIRLLYTLRGQAAAFSRPSFVYYLAIDYIAISFTRDLWCVTWDRGRPSNLTHSSCHMLTSLSALEHIIWHPVYSITHHWLVRNPDRAVVELVDVGSILWRQVFGPVQSADRQALAICAGVLIGL